MADDHLTNRTREHQLALQELEAERGQHEATKYQLNELHTYLKQCFTDGRDYIQIQVGQEFMAWLHGLGTNGEMPTMTESLVQCTDDQVLPERAELCAAIMDLAQLIQHWDMFRNNGTVEREVYIIGRQLESFIKKTVASCASK